MKKLFRVILAITLIVVLCLCTPVAAYASDGSEDVPAVVIIKNPTKEYFHTGSHYYFTAAAQNATSMRWILVHNETLKVINIEDAAATFSGLSTTTTVDESGRDRVDLYNMPASLDNWRVQAIYYDANGKEYWTSGATLYWIRPEPEPCYPPCWSPCQPPCIVHCAPVCPPDPPVIIIPDPCLPPPPPCHPGCPPPP